MTQNKKISWGEGTSYESPLVKTFAISTEGVLCQSGYKWTEGGAGTYTEGVDIFDNGSY